jgi:hypothetical protein
MLSPGKFVFGTPFLACGSAILLLLLLKVPFVFCFYFSRRCLVSMFRGRCRPCRLDWLGNDIAYLEAAGCWVIQVDEPALREAMPLRAQARDD